MREAPTDIIISGEFLKMEGFKLWGLMDNKKWFAIVLPVSLIVIYKYIKVYILI